MTLQFAVIVRTDDRRAWDLQNPTSSLFIERLITKLEKQASIRRSKRKPMSSLVQRVRDGLLEEGRALCDWAKLFSNIVDLVKESGPTIWTGSFCHDQHWNWHSYCSAINEDSKLRKKGSNSIEGLFSRLFIAFIAIR